MQIKDIFAKDLFRPINGVVKAEQKDDAIVWQELNEYVITREMDRHLRRFFESFNSVGQSEHDLSISALIGVWISGFFGSGKSHFLKIISYILQNIEATDPVTRESRRAVDFFENKIQDPMFLADVKKAAAAGSDVILFNIDSKADVQEGRAALLSVFWKVFNEMQGFSGDAPHIAEMERYLSNRGRYGDFCSRFQELSSENWEEVRDAYYFRKDEVVQALSMTLGQRQESAEEWFDKAEQNMSLTIENFAGRVKEYLDKKGKDHRIIFLVDEVGQFIGDDGHMMLNLQTLTEDLGRICQGRAWVVVTSQEDMESIIGNLKSSRAYDFSKIQDRFTTRLSLSSSNTDEVIQSRLLEKKSEASRELDSLFNSKGDILRNQLSFTQDSVSLRSFDNNQDFVKNYPFPPFHFQLVQKVFESIRTAGATGMHLGQGERSMLDAFQSAAKNISEQHTGALVPLHLFYPPIESFLDTAVKRTVDQARENPGLQLPLDIQLLQTLFLIRYVEILKPNVDNLVTLFIQEVDADRLSLKQEIEAGLQRLEQQTLISRNGDLYFFLTNEERDVNREIKGVDVTGADEVRLLSEIVFADILKDQKQYRYKPYMRDYGFNRFLDGHPFGTRLDQEISLEVITPLNDEFLSFVEMRCISHTSEDRGRILIRLGDSQALEREVRTFLQTDKYIRQKSDISQTHSFKRILRDKQEENHDRRNRMRSLLEHLVVEGGFYAQGQVLEVKSSSPKAAIENGIEYVIQNLYNKFSYLKKLHQDPVNEIKAVLLTTDIGRLDLQNEEQEPNRQAMEEIREYISLMAAKKPHVILSDLVEHFRSRPFGWPEWEVVLLVAKLYMSGELNLIMDGASLEPREAVDPMLRTTRWRNIKILKRKTPSMEDMRKARKHCQDLFGKIGPESPDDLDKTIRLELETRQKTLQQYRQLASTGEYPGQKEIQDGLACIHKLLTVSDTYEFIQNFNQCREDLDDTIEDLHTLDDFYTNQLAVWEKLKNSLSGFSRNKAVLAKHQEASRALARLEEIQNAPSPYQMLKEVEPLVSQVSRINEQLVQQRREKALMDVESGIEQVKQELQSLNSSSDFNNQVLFPLQQFKKHIAEETSIPNISYQLEEFRQTQEEALDKVEENIREEAGQYSLQPEKETRVIKFSTVYPRQYLESNQDVEEFVQNLKQKLLQELKDNVRIRLQ